MNTEQVLLEKVRIAAQTAFGPQVLHDMDVRFVNDVAGHLLLQMRSFLYAERLEPIIDRVSQQVPRSPWQAYKKRWFPHTWLGRALLRIAPVRERTITAEFRVERLRAFPDNSMVYPDTLGSHVALYQHQPPYWT